MPIVQVEMNTIITFLGILCATVQARLTAPIARKDGRRHYLRVCLQKTGAGYEATLIYRRRHHGFQRVIIDVPYHLRGRKELVESTLEKRP